LSYVAETVLQGGFYQITVNLKNVPLYKSPNFLGILRKEWILFIPTWKYLSVNETDFSNGVYRCTFGMPYDYSLGIYTLINAYKLEYGASVSTIDYDVG